MTSSDMYDAVESSPKAEILVRKPTATESKPNFNMFMSVMVAMIGAMMFGLDQGNFGNVQAFTSFRQDWCVGHFDDGNPSACDDGEAEHNDAWNEQFVLWGATLITIGAAAGALLTGPYIANSHGRRPCIGAGGAICFAGCLLASHMAFGSVIIFMVGRFVTGFGIGVSCYALPMYNAEISTPGLRGMTGSFFQLNVVVGGLFACLITLFYKEWEFGILLPGLAGAVLMVAAPFLPESPRYVMQKKGYQEGLAELKRVRAGDVDAEAEEMRRQIEEESGIESLSFLQLFQERNVRKRVVIACTLVASQQFTGVNAFLGYAATIFKNVGIDSPILFNTFFNGIMIVGCIAGLLLVDSKYGGRKIQLLLATAVMGPPLVLAGLAIAFNWPGVITMVCVCIYGLGFQFAWGTIPWIYPAEIFSMAEKEKAVSLAVFVNYVNNGIIVAVTPIIMSWSVPGTMFFFGGLNILNGFFVSLYIKETKGVPLESVPALFAKRRGAEDYHETSSDCSGYTSDE